MSTVDDKGGLIASQKQLICQTLQENQEIYSIPDANRLIRTRLCFLKTFIVLDNVDKAGQLEKLGLTRDCLSAGSRVIVISRDRHILDEYGMDKVYDAPLLDMDEAHQLFCRKAFKSHYLMSCEDISTEYEKLTDLALSYAQGLPLAIDVLGSFLYGRDISEWKSALARLEDNPEKAILDVLQVSFDGLRPAEQGIFLDIACFFNHLDEGFVKGILNYRGFFPDIGIRVLIERSLISIIDSKVIMHGMLQELGRKIVRQDAPSEPWKWSRIWSVYDFQLIMPEAMVMDNVEAIIFPFRNICLTLRADVLSRMNRLRLILIQEHVKFSESLTCLSNELQYLGWEGYPFTYFPSRCEISKLVVLHLPRSKIKELWEGTKALDHLKIMNLEYSESLVKIPDLSLAPKLEKLNLEGCTNLVHIHPSIGLLRQLAHLNLENCTSLQSLPNTILDVSSLATIKLRGCSKLFQSTSDTAIQCQSTFSAVKRLKRMLPLHFFNFRRHNDEVGSLTPSGLAHFNKLRKLDLSYCNLFNIPEAMASLYCLEVLHLAGNNFVKLLIIKELPRLTILELDHCKQLKELASTDLPAPKELVYREKKRRGTGWMEERGWIEGRRRARLQILNCPKLVGMEDCSSIALSWMMQFLKVHNETSPVITVAIPGTQIPSWFSSQSVGGMMEIELFPYVHDCNWIGLVMCAAFVKQCTPDYLINCFGFELTVAGCLVDVGTSAMTYGIRDESVHHLYLCYLGRQELIDIIERRRADDPVDFKFRVYSVHSVSMNYGAWGWFKVEHCGMRNVFKQDLEEHNGDE